MKKFLLFTFFTATITVTAQILETDNYNTYTIGNIGTDITGTTAGQGGMYTTGTNGSNSDFQIFAVDAAHINSLQVKTGATATAASSRTVSKNGLDTVWNNRTPGNNVIKGTLEIYTGTSSGVVRTGSRIFSTTGQGIIGIFYNTSTKAINTLANFTNSSGTPSGIYQAVAGTSFPANTWISVGYTYDPINATATYTINGMTYPITPPAGSTITPGLVPLRHDITGLFITGNSVVNTFAVDNYSIEAINPATLSANEVSDKKLLSISPNPTSDYLTINSKEKIKSVRVFDVSGRKINLRYDGNVLDVMNLEKGTYILTIQTDQNTFSKEFIKK